MLVHLINPSSPPQSSAQYYGKKQQQQQTTAKLWENALLKNLNISDSVTKFSCTSNTVSESSSSALLLVLDWSVSLSESSKSLCMSYSLFSDLFRVGVAFSGSLLSPTCVTCTVEVSSSTLASRSTVSPQTLPTAAESISSLLFHLNVPIFWRLSFLTSQTSPFHICRHLHSLIEQVNTKIYKKSLEERSQLCKGSNSLYREHSLFLKLQGEAHYLV